MPADSEDGEGLSDAEWDAYADGTGISGAQLKEAVYVGKWALNRYGSVCRATECGGYIYFLNGRFTATAAVEGVNGEVDLASAKKLAPRRARIVLDYDLHDVPSEGMTSKFFSRWDINQMNNFATKNPGCIGGVVGAEGSGFFSKLVGYLIVRRFQKLKILE